MQLSFAPRPIDGELLSSWGRRIAAANALRFEEFQEAFPARFSDVGRSTRYVDCGTSVEFRAALAQLVRVPERWIWSLDLKAQYPYVAREWLELKPDSAPAMGAKFCPECFCSQIASHTPLHLAAEWAMSFITRCRKHGTLLESRCRPEAIEFLGLEDQPYYSLRATSSDQASPCCSDGVRTLIHLQQTILRSLRSEVPDPFWIGHVSGRRFLRLIRDLIWMLTTNELLPGASFLDAFRLNEFGILHRYLKSIRDHRRQRGSCSRQ